MLPSNFINIDDKKVAKWGGRGQKSRKTCDVIYGRTLKVLTWLLSLAVSCDGPSFVGLEAVEKLIRLILLDALTNQHRQDSNLSLSQNVRTNISTISPLPF